MMYAVQGKWKVTTSTSSTETGSSLNNNKEGTRINTSELLHSAVIDGAFIEYLSSTACKIPSRHTVKIPCLHQPSPLVLAEFVRVLRIRGCLIDL